MAEDLMPISAEVGLVMCTTLESEDEATGQRSL